MMADKYKGNDKIVIGAGTVLDPETARACILAGANYIVSPGLNVDTIRLCNRYRVPMLPGVMTPTEAITAMEAGCDIIKISQATLWDRQLSAPSRDPFHRASSCRPAALTWIMLTSGSRQAHMQWEQAPA